MKEEQFPLEESQACPCEEYLSQPCGNWSACLLPARSLSDSVQGWMNPREVKECGHGLRYRAVACVDLRGHLVEPSLCTDTGRVHRGQIKYSTKPRQYKDCVRATCLMVILL